MLESDRNGGTFIGFPPPNKLPATVPASVLAEARSRIKKLEELLENVQAALFREERAHERARAMYDACRNELDTLRGLHREVCAERDALKRAGRSVDPGDQTLDDVLEGIEDDSFKDEATVIVDLEDLYLHAGR